MRENILKNGIVKMIQISDTHLFSDDELDMFGVRTNIKYQGVIEKIVDEDIFDTDLIFLTGDMSQDETEQSYQKIVNSLDRLNIPVYWIPGNHDNALLMESIFQQSKNFKRVHQLSLLNWKLIFINTKSDGIHEGYLSKSELNILRKEILSTNEKIAIVMHHHPAKVNTPLVDSYILKNRDEFWEIVSGTGVKLIICGHVHGDYTFKHNNITIESAPATCLQWYKGTTDLKIDHKVGYKVYNFDHYYYNALSKMW
jgi:3',5'-cyclic-AMP phosphodiesterase